MSLTGDEMPRVIVKAIKLVSPSQKIQYPSANISAANSALLSFLVDKHMYGFNSTTAIV